MIIRNVVPDDALLDAARASIQMGPRDLLDVADIRR